MASKVISIELSAITLSHIGIYAPKTIYCLLCIGRSTISFQSSNLETKDRGVTAVYRFAHNNYEKDRLVTIDVGVTFARLIIRYHGSHGDIIGDSRVPISVSKIQNTPNILTMIIIKNTRKLGEAKLSIKQHIEKVQNYLLICLCYMITMMTLLIRKKK